jgi:hypothetical protein
MIQEKTVFVLGAGASCPYGYPSSARLRELICLNVGFMNHYTDYRKSNLTIKAAQDFITAFSKSSIQSIDMFIANNPKLARIGKYIIAFEIFRAERDSLFGEEAKWRQEERSKPSDSKIRRNYVLGTADYLGGDWYFYLFNQLIRELPQKDGLPDFSDHRIAFITFNYDRSLEQFFYEALRYSFTEVSEYRIVENLKQLKILHIFGQIAPLEWQDSEKGVNYKPDINENLLQNSAINIKTIYEQKESPEINTAQQLLAQAKQIFFLGFGYAEENLEILKPQDRKKKDSRIYGTTFGLEPGEIHNINFRIIGWLPVHYSERVEIGNRDNAENMDCLKLLRNHL